jgi:hypothetical protein
MPRVLIFAGPTLARASQIAPQLPLGDIIVLPPVQRGDVPRVVQSAARPGVLAIVDGYFHLANLAVGHMELRLALSEGWEVWGLGSMGAIRAAEMYALGVRGFGEVCARYRDDPDFRDDEVALLHEPNPPYREGSEPLVHMRVALADLVERGALSIEDERAIIERLMSLWFGDRSLALLRDLVYERRPELRDQLQQWWRGFDRHRIKARDLVRFVEEQPWHAHGG